MQGLAFRGREEAGENLSANILLPGNAILHDAGQTISSQINLKDGYDKESLVVYKMYY